ncbi:hypothetical protein ACJJIE_00135 (plasmid) [Microbulbifer sp. TRSA001]|uniref:hypothetical protein n=1 Tax=Microbulbifer sp. TRSA001 TaxID=3243381 RepID=UPI0040397546
MEGQPVTNFGQIKQGDTLVIERRQGGRFVVQVRQVIAPGTGREEVVLSIGKNDYFIVSMFIDGTSWVRKVWRLPGVRLTNITNNMEAFPR